MLIVCLFICLFLSIFVYCLFVSLSELGAHIDGFMGVVAHTLVIGSSPENPVTGRKADVIQAAYVASELALRMMKPGGENMIVTKTMQRVVAEFDCVPIEGTYML